MIICVASFRLDCDDVYNLIKNHMVRLLDALCSNEHELFNMENNNVKVIGENYYQVKNIYLTSFEKEHIPNSFYDIGNEKNKY